VEAGVWASAALPQSAKVQNSGPNRVRDAFVIVIN